MDKYFRIETIRCTPNPQQVCWLAMHQDYSADAVVDRLDRCPNETKAGEHLVNHCLKHLHLGVLEHPQITFNCVGFPHHTVMQLRTHRISTTFDVQSLRYCSQHIIDVAKSSKKVEDVFFLRPPGNYTDRHGSKYVLTDIKYQYFRSIIKDVCLEYSDCIKSGMSEEHCRELIPQSIRQNFVVSFNARSLLHVLDNRYKKDAQLEIQQFSELLFQRFQEWMPQIAEWYQQNRLGKNKLAP